MESYVRRTRCAGACSRRLATIGAYGASARGAAACGDGGGCMTPVVDNYPFLRLRYERLARRLSLDKAGRLSGMTSAEVSLIENGRLVPSAQQLEKLAKAFHVPANVLLKPVSIHDDPEKVAMEVLEWRR